MSPNVSSWFETCLMDRLQRIRHGTAQIGVREKLGEIRACGNQCLGCFRPDTNRQRCEQHQTEVSSVSPWYIRYLDHEQVTILMLHPLLQCVGNAVLQTATGNNAVQIHPQMHQRLSDLRLNAGQDDLRPQ